MAANDDSNKAEAVLDGNKSSTTSAHEARLLCRQGLVSSTAGLAPGFLQANLIVIPSRHASDFRDLCARNTVPCPLLGYTPVGDPTRIIPDGVITTADFDIRTDFASYRVLHAGEIVSASQKDILSEWTDDSVGFLIGCSFSFEESLLKAGFRVCHVDAGTNCAMYKTNIPVLPAGIFCDGATYVVSMRTYRHEDIEEVRRVTRPFLATHGEPIAWGWEGSERIGIRNVDEPDFGVRQTFREGEVPVYWVSLIITVFCSSALLQRTR